MIKELLVILCLVASPVFAGEITDITNLMVAKEGDKFVYTGTVIFRATLLPAPDVRATLVQSQPEWKVFDECITDSAGSFRLVGPTGILQILLQPKEHRKLTYDFGSKPDEPTPLIRRIARDIRKTFKIENYGYYKLLKRKDTYVELREEEPYLCGQRAFDKPPFSDDNILNDEPYDCFEGAYAITQYSKHRYGKMVIDAVPFAWAAKDVQGREYGPMLNHALARIAIEEKGKIYRIIFDATPLNIGLNPKVDFQVVEISGAISSFHHDRFKKLSKEVTLKGLQPMKFEPLSDDRGFYIMAGLRPGKEAITYNLEIFDVSPGTGDQLFKVNNTIGLYVSVPRGELAFVRSRLRKAKPNDVLSVIPPESIRRAGLFTMNEVVLENQDILYYLITKTREGR